MSVVDGGSNSVQATVVVFEDLFMLMSVERRFSVGRHRVGGPGVEGSWVLVQSIIVDKTTAVRWQGVWGLGLHQLSLKGGSLDFQDLPNTWEIVAKNMTSMTKEKTPAAAGV